jgi:hypothetical protein
MLVDINTIEPHARPLPPHCTAPLNPETSNIWYINTHDSMSITLDTAAGPLMIATAYIPSGVDNLSN